MLRIGILGTRGVPNHYGGFEQLAQYLSAGLVEKGHEVYVYNSHNHPYKEKNWNGVNIIHCFDPEYAAGIAGQFIYDLNCTLDARKKKFDVLLILGYTSSSVWGWMYPEKTVTINHMDGLEWKRQKYGFLTRKFLKYAEKLAIRFSSFYIADSVAISVYLNEKYRVNCAYIAYGADIRLPENNVSTTISDTERGNYHLLIARMEKENNIEMILDGMHLSNSAKRFLIVGGTHTRFGKYLVNKYKKDTRIRFAGSIYNPDETNQLKQNCSLYFHGHSVGGTNPSLLEAMACGAIVCAHENIYNKSILGKGGYYFSKATDVTKLIEAPGQPEIGLQMINENLTKIKESFQWDNIINSYEQFMITCYNQQQHEALIVYPGYTS